MNPKKDFNIFGHFIFLFFNTKHLSLFSDVSIENPCAIYIRWKKWETWLKARPPESPSFKQKDRRWRSCTALC